MPFDAHKNLAISTVATAPSPATSGTTLSVTAGEGGRFPAAPFNATVWPASQPPTPANAELVRVTAVTGDGLTISRAAEGSTARAIVAGDLIAATITAKVVTDIEAGTNFPQLSTPGGIQAGADLVLTAPSYAIVRTATPPGADTSTLYLVSTPSAAAARGAYLTVGGNQAGSNGNIALTAGDIAAGGQIQFRTGAETMRGVMHRSGGLSWGGTSDPGVGNVLVGPLGHANGQPFIYLYNDGTYCTLQIGVTGATNTAQYFFTGSGQAGSIALTGTTTAYNTTSDQRLKTDRGLLTDPEVLRHTKIHHFTWNTDGTRGRGVFAQEAIAVLPSAVSIGTDERDEHGNLTHPWGVDYAKYVPDLIAGWQHHDQRLAALERLTNRTRTYTETEVAADLDRARARGALVSSFPPPRMNRLIAAIRAWWARPSWV